VARVNATLSVVLYMFKEGFRWWNIGLRRGGRLRAVLDHPRRHPDPDRRRAGGLSDEAAVVDGTGSTWCWRPVRWPRLPRSPGCLPASFMPDGAGQRRARRPLLPHPATLDQYRAPVRRAWTSDGRWLNSTILASAVTVVSLLLNSMAGYAFARLRFRGRRPRVLPAAGRAGDPGPSPRCCRCS